MAVIHAAPQRRRQITTGTAHVFKREMREERSARTGCSEGRNAAADRPPVRCSATRPPPRADPSTCRSSARGTRALHVVYIF